MQIWIDVEDLFVHSADGARRMSGIQRFEAELCRALQAGAAAATLPGIAAVRFLRHEAARLAFREIGWPELLAVLAQLSAEAPERVPEAVAPAPLQDPASSSLTVAPAPPKSSWPRRVARHLPAPVRRPIGAALRAQREALRKTARAVRAVAQGAFPLRPDHPAVPLVCETASEKPPRPRSVNLATAPGDVLLTAGAAWIFPRYAARVASLRRHGVRFAVVVHDIIPLRRPEWCDPKHSLTFREWLDATLPQCDTLLTVSHASAREIIGHAVRSGLDLPHDPVVVPMGGGFGPPSKPVANFPTAKSQHLPSPGSYALLVSTLEPRKNQAYLVQVWRQLLEELPCEQVPTLVLAGHVGSMVGDLLQELHNSGYLAGAVQLIGNASDAELAALYRGCRFTLFPSLYEGWGLPVSESLAFGKPCLASDTTSIPEAGGGLARYFDPLNVRSGVLAVRALIEHPERLARWQAQIVREHRATPWSDTAMAVATSLKSSNNQVAEATSIESCDFFTTKLRHRL